MMKAENAFFVEREADTEKIGANSPKNRMFYAHVWDPEKGERVAVLVDTEDCERGGGGLGDD